jgi:hypothetical protein
MTRRTGLLVLLLSGLSAFSTATQAQCPEEPPLQNYVGAGTTSCPCFIPGEEAGVVLDLPADEYPIEILRVGVAWGSQFGGAPATLEQSIHIYAGALPDPGAPIFNLDGPQLTDGVVNEFDIEPLPGEVIIDSGPFTVTLEFANSNSGDPFAPTVVHDGNGCQIGRNVIKASPGGWLDACLQGVTGDWVFYVVYRPVTCGPVTTVGAVPDGNMVPGTQLELQPFAGNLLLSWGASCVATDTDYEVYEGTIGDYYSHISRLCSTGGATQAIVAPLAGDTYYLVVPRNAENEGSYGVDSSGSPRPMGAAGCLLQQAGSCP